MDYLKVVDHDSLVRDKSTGAIINTDKSVFDSVKRRRKTLSSVDEVFSEVKSLKKELSEIKNLLREIVANGNT